LGCVGDR